MNNVFNNELLKDKTILITGSTSGLGKELAIQCKNHGANVIISGRNKDKCKKCSDELQIPYIHLDVLDIATFHDKLMEANSIYNNIDCLVNNAGVSSHKFNILNTNYQDWNYCINTNCRAPYFLTKEFINFHLNYKKSDFIRKIIFTASNSAIHGYDDLYPYTKNFLVYFCQSIADKYFKNNLRLNCVSPSGIEETGFNGNKSHLLENSCMSNLSKKSLNKIEVCDLYLYLMSDVSNSINGANFVINEGKKY